MKGPPPTLAVTNRQTYPESASDAYARILLMKRIGFPLWMPEPPNYPSGYSIKGVGIGDVGIITFDGRFRFFFNVCLPSSHPINRKAPPSLVPFVLDPDEDIEKTESIFCPDYSISTSTIRERLNPETEGYESTLSFYSLLKCNPRSSHNRQLQFSCSSTEGALLVLPNGASRQELRFRHDFHEYARQHVQSWFEHVHGTLRLEAEAGPLYLVTGHDKCENWCVASYSNFPVDTSMDLIFTPTGVTGGGIVLYSSSASGPVDRRTFAQRENNTANQCVFIRGYKMTLCKSLIEKLLVGPVKISDIIPPNPTNVAGVGVGGIPSSTLLGQSFSWLVGGTHASGHQQLSEPLTAATREAVAIEYFPNLSEVLFSRYTSFSLLKPIR